MPGKKKKLCLREREEAKAIERKAGTDAEEKKAVEKRLA